jgi:AcrR family transcriptional regulator
VEESIRQFGRDGYNGASLERIAQAVGVRKQTLLYYFPTKDDLLEAGRLGPTAFERFGAFLEPLRVSATEFLQTGMDAGLIRKQDPALLLFTLYTAVIGSLTEASVLASFVGADDARSSLKRREAEVVELVRAALRPPEA